jgi:hypothetical protein
MFIAKVGYVEMYSTAENCPDAWREIFAQLNITFDVVF